MLLRPHAALHAGAALALALAAASCHDETSGSGGSTTTSTTTTATGGTGGTATGGSGGTGGTATGGGTGGTGGSATGGSGTGGSAPIVVSLLDSPCPPRFVADIVACADAQLADPDSPFTYYTEAVIACADAEPLGDAYDASCASDVPTPIYCGAEYGAVWTDLYDRCTTDGITAFAERTCVFGARYRDALDAKRLLVLSKEVLDASSTLTSLEAAQLVSAIEPSSHTATKPEEVFAAVDEGKVNRIQLADRWNGKRYTAIEYGAGDNSFGRFFLAGTATGVADIQDGDLYHCTAAPGPGGEACDTPATCTAPLTCAGKPPAGEGLCADITPASKDGEGCAAPLECGPDAYCTGAGICVSPWKTGVFGDIPFAPLVNGGELVRTLAVHGLATVPIDGVLDLVIRHPDTTELTVTLINPFGTEITVFAGDPAGQDLVLEGVALPVPGDESINGDWTLRVHDAAGGDTGWLSHWRMSFTSRWD